MIKYVKVLILLIVFCFPAGCKQRASMDITPHHVIPEANKLYQKALRLSASYDVDSTEKSICLLDSALAIDSMNPDYYGAKAKWLSELGYLDSALTVQRQAANMGAVTGEYLFQLGLFQAAKERYEEAHESFRRSNEFQKAILKRYPDSLGAFVIQQAASACFHGQDSLFMADIESIRERFPDRLMEVETTRRLKPLHLIQQIKSMEIPSPDDMDSIPRPSTGEVKREQ